MILNDFDFSKVLRTVIEIARITLEKDNLVSFAFVGVYKEGSETKETPSTQRYKIYKRVSEYFMGSETFTHSYEEKSNCYLLVNNNNQNPQALHESIVEMFANHYQELAHL